MACWVGTAVHLGVRPYLSSLTLLAAIALAVGGCGGSHVAHHTLSQGERLRPVTPDSNISYALVDVVAPTSGASYDSWTSAVNNFTAAIRAKVIDRCLAADGLPAAPRTLTPAPSSFNLMPDITALRARGQFEVVLQVPRDPTAGMSASERVAYHRALLRCTAKAPHFTVYGRGAGAIESRWMNVVTVIARALQPYYLPHQAAQVKQLTVKE